MTERTAEQESKFFRILYCVLYPLVRVLYPMRVKGLENIPDGPAVICANHSNFIDPLLICVALGRKRHVHFMAKRELKDVFLVGKVLSGIGVCFVKRGDSDIDAIRSMLRYLKRGDKVVLFPEGTRVHDDNAVDAKTGAVRIASKTKAPIIPIYIPRGKRIFSRVNLVIGEPYMVSGKSHDEYVKLADGVMDEIYKLRDGA